jgi:hypothetical protein
VRVVSERTAHTAAAFVAALTAVLMALASSWNALGAQPVYVANPGKSFGPLEIGFLPPPLYDLLCKDPTLGVIVRHYYRMGLSAGVPDTQRSAELAIPEGRIMVLSAAVETLVLADIYEGGCVDSAGRRISRRLSYRVPSSVLYVSNRGVTFGASVEAVIAAHGAPRETGNYQGGNKVAFLDYCGIMFQFDESARVHEITVRDARLCRHR